MGLAVATLLKQGRYNATVYVPSTRVRDLEPPYLVSGSSCSSAPKLARVAHPTHGPSKCQRSSKYDCRGYYYSKVTVYSWVAAMHERQFEGKIFRDDLSASDRGTLDT